MTTGRRTGTGAASIALAFLCLLALASPLAQATFPGRPGLIVFSKIEWHGDGKEVTGGLFAIRPGEHRPRQLTTTSTDYFPSFAPSGKRLVFDRFGDPGSGIYVLDLRTGKTRRLALHRSSFDPAFGPKGMIVFSRFVNGSGNDLFLRTKSGAVQRLTADQGRDSEAVFTPDGKRIVFWRDYRKAVLLSHRGAASKKKEGLYSIRVDGTGLEFLRAVKLPKSDPDISPNGRKIAFNASFSPDGRKLAYANRNGLWVRRASGKGSPTLLLGADYRPYEEGGSLIVQPAWQPLP